MHSYFPFARLMAWPAAVLLFVTGCSPTFDWREVHGAAPASYTVLLPAKPTSFSRQVDLGEVSATMTMTAAEIKGITFAVATAELPDAATAMRVLPAMKTALVRNINGHIRREKASAAGGITSLEVEALGTAPADRAGTARLLVAHFIANDRQVYQVLLVGPEKAVSREAVATFFTSFKLK